MNRLVVPPSPNWYNVEILACAPDNTLIYGSKNDLVIIHTIPGCEPYDVKIVDQAHKQRVTSVETNIQWGLPNKWVLSSGEDNYVKLWSIDKLENIYSHDVHKENKCKIVGAKFLSENKILSVSENGVLYMWHPLTKECTKLSFVFPMKVTVKCFSPCPHATYITAFGLKNGLIVIANIKKSGSILFKLRGHNSEVLSLSWCPAPFNIFSSKPKNYIEDNRPEVEKPNEENEIELEESPEGRKHQNDSCVNNDTKNSEDIPILENLESEKLLENHSEEKHEQNHDSQMEKKEVDINEVVNELQKDEKVGNTPSISISAEEKDLDNENYVESINEKVENAVKLSNEEDESKICEEEPENQSFEDGMNKTVSSGEVEVANHLLASSGRDNNVYIWRAVSDGRIQSVFKIPEKKTQQSRGKSKESWIVLKWITPSILLATSNRGEVLKYTLPTTEKNKKQGVVVHNDHRSVVFSIAAHIPTFTAENWRSKNETKFWTFGHNLYLFNTVLDCKSTHLISLETLCAVVYCSAQSPLDPNRIAFGLSNGTIKIWNASDRHIKTFSTIHYSNKIHSRITYLAFHPKDEQMLAFCTDEGTIGVLDIYKLGPVKFFKQTFANTVHKIQWGPRFEDKVFLYAVGEGQLICFKSDVSSKAQPLKIALPEETHVYTFAWKLDYSMMILVDYSGKIMVLSSDLNVKAVYYQNKRLLYLTWHPDSESVSDEASERSHWLAAAIDHSVYIFDFAEVSNKKGTLNIQDITKTILNGHKSNIKSLAWSPFNGDKLVSAGEDGLAHVWNVATKQIISSFYEQNFQPLRSIIWSPVQEDILICSVANASLIVWKMSDYPAPLKEEVMEKYNKHLKKEKKCVSARVEVSADSVLKKIKKSMKDVIFPSILPSNMNTSSEMVNLFRDLLDRKLNGGDKKKNDITNFIQIFGDKEYILKILAIAEASHIEKGKHEAASMVSFWKGDLQSSIKEAIEQRRVSPLLISLAPTVSLSMWQKACETYASQLEDNPDSDPLEMATYYMASQNIEKAITSLCEKEMFKYALCLAKCRLPEDNVFVEDILKKWAAFSTNCGSLELAAQCHIMLGNFEEAAKVLFRRSDLDILNFALELAKKSNNTEIISALEYRIKAFANEDNIQSETKPLPDIKELMLENIKMEKQNGHELGENMNDDITEGNQTNFEIVSDHQNVDISTINE